jgi:PIN domain nuclease of toxin-antitoxin system
MLNLDTDILIYALEGELTAREKRLLSGDRWGISAIVLWELSKLRQLGRIAQDVNTPEFASLLARLELWPLDLAVCRRLHDLDFRADPADEIIAATSLVHNAPLVTRDRKIRASKLVPLA